MFYEDFTKLNEDLAQPVLDHLNEAFPDLELDEDDITIQSADIPFYHGYEILEVYNHKVHPVKKDYFIYNEDDGEAHLMDYTNDFIYKINKKIPIMLDQESILDYVKFFFTYVSGSQGQFKIINSMGDIPWRDTPPPNAHDAISGMINPVAIIEENIKKGTFKLQAYMIFKTGLFKSIIDVDKFGQITMSEEEMLIEDMPLIDDIMVN